MKIITNTMDTVDLVTLLHRNDDMFTLTLVFLAVFNFSPAQAKQPLISNAQTDISGHGLPAPLTPEIPLKPAISEERLLELGAELEPTDSPVWAYSQPDYLFLKKIGATISYQTHMELPWDIFHLAVHVGGNPDSDRVAAGIELLAKDLKGKGIPSVLLDRYQNSLNRKHFELEVNDYIPIL